MLTPEKINAMKIINSEYKELNKNPLVTFGITVGLFNEDNMFEWKCTILGPKDTFYKGGVFYLKIIFPDNYPNAKPEMIFLTPIYHLNVKYFSSENQPLGHICINTLNDWKPGDSVLKILPELFALLHKNNPESPYDDIKHTRRNEFVNNPNLFAKKAKYFTDKYASPNDKLNPLEFPNRWDFTYNEKIGSFLPTNN